MSAAGVVDEPVARAIRPSDLAKFSFDILLKSSIGSEREIVDVIQPVVAGLASKHRLGPRCGVAGNGKRLAYVGQHIGWSRSAVPQEECKK